MLGFERCAVTCMLDEGKGWYKGLHGFLLLEVLLILLSVCEFRHLVDEKCGLQYQVWTKDDFTPSH